MRRRVLIGALVLATGCTHAQAPKARLAGEILSITGVLGLIGGALTQGSIGHTPEVMGTFSVMSATGIGLYAAGELTDPNFGPAPETLPEKHRRWAKILTERAGGAARDGNCARVKRLEKRVHVYNREVHDFVFMADPEIVKCLEGVPTAEPPVVPALPGQKDPPADR